MKSIFLDKNPLFDYARKKFFNEIGLPKHSLELIEKIKDEELEAHIESMTVFSLYNYIFHKASDPKRTSQNMNNIDAEKKARIFVKYLFKSKTWIFHGMTKEAVMSAIECEDFCFEDACQYHAFKISNCQLFITWNIRDFKIPEVMTPKDFLKKYC